MSGVDDVEQMDMELLFDATVKGLKQAGASPAIFRNVLEQMKPFLDKYEVRIKMADLAHNCKYAYDALVYLHYEYVI